MWNRQWTFSQEHPIEDEWQSYDRSNIRIEKDALEISDGWVSAKNVNLENFIFEFSACVPEDALQVQIWAGFRHFSRDYRYVAALRGGSNNHIYLARIGAEGYDKMLALRPLEWSPVPGVWYRLRIVCEGKRIAVYMGDEERPLLLAEDTDAPFSSGSIALGGGYLPACYREVRLTETDGHYLDGAERQPDYLDSVVMTESEKERARLRERAAYRPYAVPSVSDERLELSLDGKWLFIPDYEAGQDPEQLKYDDKGAHVITVPSSWIPLQAWLEGENMGPLNKGMNDDYIVEERIRCLNQTFDYERTKAGWYRHYLDLPKGIKGKRVVLDFEGIALISAVYFNGIRVHENIGMFAPMQIDVSGCVREGRNIIAVEVYRTLSSESEHAMDTSGIDNYYAAAWDILDENEKEERTETDCERREFCTNDIAHGFYMNHPGGIWRSVRLIISDPVHVDDCFFIPSLHDASVEVRYSNSGSEEKEVTLSYEIVHKMTGEYLCGGVVETAALKAGERRTVSFSTPEVSPRLWGPGTPNLYRLTFRITCGNRVIDCFSEQVGFRTCAFEGQTLMYNGAPLWVRGGNHMPAHVKPNDAGLAEAFMKQALAHHVMATRTHVAPWSSTWLDAADEAGLMISMEGTWTWLMLDHIPSRQSIILWRNELIKLLKRHRNRPCLFLVTMNNEMKFYLHDAPDEVVIEKGRILEGGIRAVRKAMPHLPLVCDSAYYRKHAVRTGRYERIIQAHGYDDGDMDDPHGYFGWYNPDFFHFMKGEFGEEYTTPGRPCMSQECATGYPRAQDGLPVRAYLFMHQTPQTTVGKKAYEWCDPKYFLTRHGMLTKELAEMFRRVEHKRTCGVMLFAFETWFYFQHDSKRIQPMASAEKLRLAYQPVLASAELWGRHFCEGDTIQTDITLINDSDSRTALESPRVAVSVTEDGRTLIRKEIEFNSLEYFQTETKRCLLELPKCQAAARTDARLVLQVIEKGAVISQNEYDVLLSSRQWSLGNCGGSRCLYRKDDAEAKELLQRYGILGRVWEDCPEEEAEGGRLVITGRIKEEEASGIRSFAQAGGTVLLLGQGELPDGLLSGKKAVYTPGRQEIITMNIPESPVFDGIEPLDTAWFADGQKVPYAADGRYQTDRFDSDITVLAETLEWHGYIDRPTDYTKFGGTLLFTVRAGKGKILVSSLRTDACGSDPVASRLTGNILGSSL